MIKVENLHKSFGDLEVLKGVSEHIKKGEVVSVIGASGSGKSTFLRCLNMLEEPESGSIIFEGVDITQEKVNIDVHRQKMGMIFQHFNLLWSRTVAQNIAFPLEIASFASCFQMWIVSNLILRMLPVVLAYPLTQFLGFWIHEKSPLCVCVCSYGFPV